MNPKRELLNKLREINRGLSYRNFGKRYKTATVPEIDTPIRARLRQAMFNREKGTDCTIVGRDVYGNGISLRIKFEDSETVYKVGCYDVDKV